MKSKSKQSFGKIKLVVRLIARWPYTDGDPGNKFDPSNIVGANQKEHNGFHT